MGKGWLRSTFSNLRSPLSACSTSRRPRYLGTWDPQAKSAIVGRYLGASPFAAVESAVVFEALVLARLVSKTHALNHQGRVFSKKQVVGQRIFFFLGQTGEQKEKKVLPLPTAAQRVRIRPPLHAHASPDPERQLTGVAPSHLAAHAKVYQFLQHNRRRILILITLVWQGYGW